MPGVDKGMTTGPYRVASSTVVKLLMLRYAGRWWWLILLPPAVLCAMAAVYGVAFAIVAMMLVFLVYPTLLLFVYFNEVLRPEILPTTSRQRAILRLPDVTVEYLSEPDGDDEDDLRHKTPATPLTVSLADCQNVLVYQAHVLIEVRAHVYIVIPASAMPDSRWVWLTDYCQRLRR